MSSYSATRTGILQRAARSFNRNLIEFQPPSKTGKRKVNNRPGDLFDQSASWHDILPEAGWTHQPGPNGRTDWRRPGKKDGVSATTGHCHNKSGVDLLYVFSTNADPFESDKAYTPFQAYTLLFHDGNFAKAAKQLKSDQYQSRVNARQVSEAVSPLTFSEGMHVFEKWLYKLDPFSLEVVFSVVAGNHLPDDPVWIWIVAPPGSGKTELINAIHEHRDVVAVSQLTTNALMSGYRPEEMESDDESDPSLLLQLNGKTLVMKDATTLLSMSSERRSEIFGQLRDAYDGHSAKATGTVGMKSYKSKFNFIAAVTPEIERHTRAFAALGERFLTLKLALGDIRETTIKAISNAGQETLMRKELSDAAFGVLAGASRNPPIIAESDISAIADYAELLARARTAVPRDKNKMDYGVAPENPTRIAKQLIRLAKGVAMLHHRAQLTEHELGLIHRVVLDSIPMRRQLVSSELAHGPANLDALTRCFPRVGRTTLRYTLEELEHVGLIQKRKTNKFKAHRATWSIRTRFRNRLSAKCRDDEL